VISEIELGHIHGSCVDFEGKCILAIGPSGSGKSSLALSLIGLGGVLVSDDQVILSEDAKGITASPPVNITGKIEVRSIGILKCPHIEVSRINLVVDLSTEPDERIPKQEIVKIGTHPVNMIAGFGVENLPIAARLLNLYGWNHIHGSTR
jgi:HPr kinase/phosphorylase